MSQDALGLKTRLPLHICRGGDETKPALGPARSPDLKEQCPVFQWALRASHTCLSPASAGWNELLIASFSHRSVSVQDGILLATGLHVHRSSAHSAGVGSIFDRYFLYFSPIGLSDIHSPPGRVTPKGDLPRIPANISP